MCVFVCLCVFVFVCVHACDRSLARDPEPQGLSLSPHLNAALLLRSPQILLLLQFSTPHNGQLCDPQYVLKSSLRRSFMGYPLTQLLL